MNKMCVWALVAGISAPVLAKDFNHDELAKSIDYDLCVANAEMMLGDIEGVNGQEIPTGSERGHKLKEITDSLEVIHSTLSFGEIFECATKAIGNIRKVQSSERIETI